MGKDSVVPIRWSSTAKNVLREDLQEGAKKILAEAAQIDVRSFLKENFGPVVWLWDIGALKAGYVPGRIIGNPWLYQDVPGSGL